MQQLKPKNLDMVGFNILVNYFNTTTERSGRDLLSNDRSLE
jgi:hypothetical protein